VRFESELPGNDGRCVHGRMWGDRTDLLNANGVRPCKQCESDHNIWGTLKSDVGEGFCPDCERPEVEGHYESCPRRASSWLATARRIVDTETADMVDGALLDLFSASVMVQVHDALSPANRARFAAMSVTKAHTVAFQLTTRKGA